MSSLIACPEEYELPQFLASEPVADSLRAHVKGCSGCRRRLETMRTEMSAIRANAMPPTGPR
jgi:hypothetical protein